MILGTLTITGEFPNYLDGLFLGMSKRSRVVFKLTDKGYERKGYRYKTFDPERLISMLGAENTTWSHTYKTPRAKKINI